MMQRILSLLYILFFTIPFFHAATPSKEELNEKFRSILFPTEVDRTTRVADAIIRHHLNCVAQVGQYLGEKKGISSEQGLLYAYAEVAKIINNNCNNDEGMICAAYELWKKVNNSLRDTIAAAKIIEISQELSVDLKRSQFEGFENVMRSVIRDVLNKWLQQNKKVPLQSGSSNYNSRGGAYSSGLNPLQAEQITDERLLMSNGFKEGCFTKFLERNEKLPVDPAYQKCVFASLLFFLQGVRIQKEIGIPLDPEKSCCQLIQYWRFTPTISTYQEILAYLEKEIQKGNTARLNKAKGLYYVYLQAASRIEKKLRSLKKGRRACHDADVYLDGAGDYFEKINTNIWVQELLQRKEKPFQNLLNSFITAMPEFCKVLYKQQNDQLKTMITDGRKMAFPIANEDGYWDLVANQKLRQHFDPRYQTWAIVHVLLQLHAQDIQEQLGLSSNALLSHIKPGSSASFTMKNVCKIGYNL